MAIVTTNQNLSAVTYAQAEIIEIRNGATLTINATPATRPGTIQCITSGELLVTNANPTEPLIFDLHDMTHDLRFEAGGVLKFRGAPMSLGTGNGAQKTWDFTSLFGGQIRHNTYVEVEESVGNGLYLPWSVIHEDPKFNLNCGLLATIGGASPSDFTAANTAAGRVLFWNETNRTLRCGDGTNGGVIQNGLAVRIPNIFVSNRLLTNQSSVLNLITFGTPTGGNFTIEISRENGTVMGTTAAIAFNATAAQVDTAIEAVTGVGTVTPGGGALPTAVTITWAGAYANERLGVRIAANNLTGGTNAHPVVYENNAGNMSLIDLSPLGTMDAEWVSFSDKFRLATDVFKSVRLVNVGLGGDALQLNNSNGTIEVDGVSVSRSPFISQSVSQFSSVLGDVSAKRMVSAAKNLLGFNFITLPNLNEVDRVTAMIFGQRQSTNNRGLQFVTVKAGVSFTNVTSIGCAFSFQNLTDNKVVGWKYADGTLAAQNTGQAMSAGFTLNCVGVTFAGYSDAGPMSPRNYIIQTDAASSNLKLLGGATDGSNNSAGFLMQCGGMEIVNFNYSNLRSNPLLDMPTTYLANNLIAKKVFATHGSAPPTAGLDACQGGIYDMVTSTIFGITETFNGVNDFVGGNYTEPSLTPTTGHVTFGPFADGAGLELTGSAFTDALGGFLLTTAGDTAVVTMPFAMHGITGFTDTAPRLYVDAPGVAANLALFGNSGGITGGTFTLTIYDAAGALIGTTTAIAYNASSTTMGAAISAVVGAGASCSGSWAAGFQITFPAGQIRIVTIDGTNLTGGGEPGIAYAVGRARALTGVDLLGSITTAEFAMRVPGNSWPAYASLTGANLQTAFAALTGYNAGGSGLEMRIKITAGQTNPFTKFNQISIPTTVDPSLWTVGDATITFQGPNPTDVIRVVRASDFAQLYSFTGAGTKEFTVGANFNTEVFFRRELPDGTVIMRTLPATQRINFGNNGTVPLFYGAEVQLAQSADVAAIKALVDDYLDAAVSSRATQTSLNTLAGTNQTEHDATQTAIAGLSAGSGATLAEIEASTVLAKEATVASRLAASAYVEPLDATETQAAAAAALTAYDAVQPADLTGLATASQLNAVGVAIIAEVDAIPTNPVLATDARLDNLDATVSSRLAASGYTAPANSDIAAIKAKTDTLENGPTLSEIEASTVLAKEATVEGRASKADAAVINEGVKKASLLIPHSTDLPA